MTWPWSQLLAVPIPSSLLEASDQHPSNVRVCILVLKGLFPRYIKVFSQKLSSSRIHYCYIILKNVEGKKVCPFLFLENFRSLSPWGPPDFLSTCLGIDSHVNADQAPV